MLLELELQDETNLIVQAASSNTIRVFIRGKQQTDSFFIQETYARITSLHKTLRQRWILEKDDSWFGYIQLIFEHPDLFLASFIDSETGKSDQLRIDADDLQRKRKKLY